MTNDPKALEQLTAADVNKPDWGGRVPLMHAVLADDADPAVIRRLVELGADVDATDSNQNWTALHAAARDQKESIVRALLEAGASVDPVDVFGNTPLWYAVLSSSSDLCVVQALLEYGAQPSRKNNYGASPIDAARETGRDAIVALFNNVNQGKNIER